MYYGSDASDSKTEVVIDYKTIKDFNKMGNIHFTTESESYSHFGNMMERGVIWEVFESKTPPEVGDNIWVWHNDDAEDFYAFGPKDSFNTIKKSINKDFYVFAILILLGLISIYRFTRIMNYLK